MLKIFLSGWLTAIEKSTSNNPIRKKVMELYCPNCKTELIERSKNYVCPRHQIGECTYEPCHLDEGHQSKHYKSRKVELETVAA